MIPYAQASPARHSVQGWPKALSTWEPRGHILDARLLDKWHAVCAQRAPDTWDLSEEHLLEEPILPGNWGGRLVESGAAVVGGAVQCLLTRGGRAGVRADGPQRAGVAAGALTPTRLGGAAAYTRAFSDLHGPNWCVQAGTGIRQGKEITFSKCGLRTGTKWRTSGALWGMTADGYLFPPREMPEAESTRMTALAILTWCARTSTCYCWLLSTVPCRAADCSHWCVAPLTPAPVGMHLRFDGYDFCVSSEGARTVIFYDDACHLLR